MHLAQYIFACLVMGIGIAIDVALASLAHGRHLTDPRQARRWVSRITATHTLFPMAGYYFALEVEQFAGLRVLLGIIAAGLIAFLLYQIISGAMANEDDAEEPNQALAWAAVLAVSWDALLSGPAKAAQAVGWTPLEVLLSFPLASLVVAVFALGSTAIAKRIVTHGAADPVRYASFNYAAIIVEIAVFAYFGALAFCVFTLSDPDSVKHSILFAVATAIAAAMILRRKR